MEITGNGLAVSRCCTVCSRNISRFPYFIKALYKHLLFQIYVVLWWILTFGLCNFVVLIASLMYDPDFKSTRLESALYWAFGKNLFALGIAIAIFGFTVKIGCK